MRYEKPALSFDQLAELLLSRGMTGESAAVARYLATVCYYRLSGYWYPFRVEDPESPGTRLDDFVPGTRFQDVVDRYEFDTELRSLVFQRIGRFEVRLRNQLAHEHSLDGGPFAYVDHPSTAPGMKPHDHSRFVSSIQRERERSKDGFVRHFRETYGGDHWNMPVWMATELMSKGVLRTWYENSPPEVRRRVAAYWRVHDTVLTSWIASLHVVRNVCAHHGRLWNKVLGIQPKIPRDRIWHDPVEITGKRVFGTLTILQFAQDSPPVQDRLRDRLEEIFVAYPSIPLEQMGFPPGWRKSPLWNPAALNDTPRTP